MVFIQKVLCHTTARLKTPKTTARTAFSCRLRILPVTALHLLLLSAAAPALGQRLPPPVGFPLQGTVTEQTTGTQQQTAAALRQPGLSYGDPQCAAFSPLVYNLAPFVVDSTQFRASFTKVLEANQRQTPEGVTVISGDAYLPDLIIRLRRLPLSTSYQQDLPLASQVWGIVYGSISQSEMSVELAKTYQAVYDVIVSEESRSSVIRPLLFRLYDQAMRDPRFRAALQNAVSIDIPVPANSRSLLALANHPLSIDAIPARGIVATVLAHELGAGRKPSLSTPGQVLLNQNRIFQELRYIGYSCPLARLRTLLVPHALVRAEDLRAEFDVNRVRYNGGGSTTEVPYPANVSFNPSMTFPSPNPLDPKRIIDLNRVYRGQYQATDFAYGKFDKVSLSLLDPRWAPGALTLMSTFRDRKFTIDYSPRTASFLGISDLPAMVRSRLSQYGVPSSNLTFVAQDYDPSDLGFIYPWTRDGFLPALDASGRLHKLAQTPEPTPGLTQVNFNTVGGAHYPIGRYIFLNKQDVWSRNLGDETPETVKAYKEMYLRALGREPVLLDFGQAHEGASGHVDVYMVFLPQPNGKPAIGVADVNLGRQILATQNKDRAMTNTFLMQQRSLRFPVNERPQILPLEPAALGLPQFSSLGSFEIARAKLDTDPTLETSALNPSTLDLNAQWLRQAGFEVFRFPYLPGYSHANGIPEVTANGAVFTAPSAPPFDASFAALVGRYGYSLRLIPRNRNTSDGAGYHCLTNEARFSELGSGATSSK